MATAATIAAKLTIDISDYKKGLSDAQKQLNNTQRAAQLTSAKFDGLTSSLSTGKLTTASFTESLMSATKASGVSAEKTLLMAKASGQYSDGQIRAAASSVQLTKMTRELSEAVANGSVSASEAGKQLGKFANEHMAAEKKQGNFASSLMSGVKTFAAYAAAAAAVGAAIKKAFDMSRAGATIIQTKRSFESMMATIDTSTDVLDEWRDVVGGTISDMDLMTGFQTLAAGMSNELTKAFADNNAELLKISKAASALNPQLGDTAYMYESITRGIKRQSPLILDNLGIVVKVGEANEELAKKLGVTVDALTAEEKQMALLEATLRAGDRMIEQLGGTVDSAVDPWDRFTTAIKNSTNATKEAMAETGFFQKILNLLSDDLEKSAGKTRQRIKDEKMLTEAMELGIITQAEYDTLILKFARDNEALSNTIDQTATEVAMYHGEISFGANEIRDWTNAQIDAETATKNSTKTIGELHEENVKFLDLVFEMSDEIDKYTESMNDLSDEASDVRDKIKDLRDKPWLTDNDREELEKLQGKYVDLQTEIVTTKAEHQKMVGQIVFDTAKAELAVDGLTEAETAYLINLAGLLVGVDQTAEAAALNAQTWGADFAAAMGEPEYVLGNMWSWLQLMDGYVAKARVEVSTIHTGGGGGQYIPGPSPAAGSNPAWRDIQDIIDNIDTDQGAPQAMGGYYNVSSPFTATFGEAGKEEGFFVPSGKTLWDVAPTSAVLGALGMRGGDGNQTADQTFNFYGVPTDRIPQTIEQLKALAA